MQGAIEMGFSPPNTENFSTSFENIKFGHQNILLTVSGVGRAWQCVVSNISFLSSSEKAVVLLFEE